MNEPRATAADWLAVGAGTIGALMALTDVSIVNASLPVIQGEIGATPSEGTWVGTAYLIAEIITVPLTAWLQRMLGMRRLLLGGASLFTLFSVMCGFASTLGMMIFGRIGQGLAGGVLIPTSLTIVATRLPLKQQPIGLAMTAMAALLGPLIGPLVGGWLTENVSWHLAFFINVPICLIEIALIAIAMPKASVEWHELHNADWLGIAGIAIGLGSITTLLEEGHRELWFESTLIWNLAIAGALGIGLVAVGQWQAKRPVLELSLLRQATLGSAVALMGVVGLLLYSSLFITPQFLAAVAGYNALQAGQVAFIAGIVAIPTATLYPLLSTRVDPRVIVAGAVICISFAAFLAGTLTAQSTGSDFVLVQMLFGAGTTMSAIPLQQTVMNAAVPGTEAEASGLMSVARNLGGSIGLAAIASFQDQRLEFHHWQLNSAIAANDPEAQRHLADAAALFGNGPEGLEAAYRLLDSQVSIDAFVMTCNDMFIALAAIGIVVVPLVLLLRPTKPGALPTAMH
jgi:MFS transporter, DHA2 family, multidrug resistance protein